MNNNPNYADLTVYDGKGSKMRIGNYKDITAATIAANEEGFIHQQTEEVFDMPVSFAEISEYRDGSHYNDIYLTVSEIL